MKNCLLLILLGTFCLVTASSQSMDNAELERIIASSADSIEGGAGSWQFVYHDRLMLLITDEKHNRMRLISPIHMADQLEKEQLIASLTANFHSALDVKYAISEGVMWSAFIHPLKELTEAQVRDALSQVYQAAETFGTTYSSTELIFPGNVDERQLNKKPKKKM